MTMVLEPDNEQVTAEAFTRQSVLFDDLYSKNTIVNYKRARVREHIGNYLKPCSNILELNSGTGEDALFFARQGHSVHATDISEGMQCELRKKVDMYGFSQSVSTELRSYTQLAQLENRGPYDLIFSNFAGLNCTDKLDGVLLSLSPLLKKGGLVTLVLLPKFCLWETLLLFKGKFKTAFRRFFSSKGTRAHIEGAYFKCWYYDPSFVVNTLKDGFELVDLEGLCTLVPPSYIDDFAEKHTAAYSFLTRKENRLKNKWPWKFIGDYYIITMRKK